MNRMFRQCILSAFGVYVIAASFLVTVEPARAQSSLQITSPVGGTVVQPGDTVSIVIGASGEAGGSRGEAGTA